MLLSQISPACTNSSSNLSPSPFGFPITFIPSRFRSDLTWQDHQCLSLLRPWGASLHIPPLALNVLMCLMQTTWHDLQSSSSVLLLLIFLPSFLTMLHVHVHNLLSSSIITALYCLKVSYSLETTFFLSECPLCMELSPPYIDMRAPTNATSRLTFSKKRLPFWTDLIRSATYSSAFFFLLPLLPHHCPYFISTLAKFYHVTSLE